MPKETVYGERSVFGGDDDPSRAVVEVRWDRESGFFQVVTRCVHFATGEPYAPEDMLKELRRAGIASSFWRPEGVENPPYVCLFSEGMFVSLDRYGINKLIRHLRRARDQAFGRDE